MSSPLPTLLRKEVAKAARRKLPYFGILAAGLGCVITYFIAGRLSNAAATNSAASVSHEPAKVQV